MGAEVSLWQLCQVWDWEGATTWEDVRVGFHLEFLQEFPDLRWCKTFCQWPAPAGLYYAFQGDRCVEILEVPEPVLGGGRA